MKRVALIVLLLAVLAAPAAQAANVGFSLGINLNPLPTQVAVYLPQPAYPSQPVYGPTPVYSPPPPTCYTQPGYWGRVPYVRPDGYTVYRNVWVPPQTVCQ